MANGDLIKDDSPFPSGPEMDLDMWRASSHVNPDGTRTIEAPADDVIARVYGDVTTRRIEMLGDLFEGLRRAAEKMSAAGLDVSEENQILGEFVSPKPFEHGSGS